MTRVHAIGILLLLAFGATADAETDALDSALARMGESRATFRVDPEIMLTQAGGEFKLPVFDQWFGRPVRIPFYERHLRNSLLDARGQLQPTFNTCTAFMAMGTRRSLIPPSPLEKYRKEAEQGNALFRALAQLDTSAIIPQDSDLPSELVRLAGMLLFAVRDAIEWREIALRKVAPERRPEIYRALTEPLEKPAKPGEFPDEMMLPRDYAAFHAQRDLMAAVDLRLLFAAADDLTSVVDAVCAELDTLRFGNDPVHYFCETRLGYVEISNHALKTGINSLLLLSLGGDNVYRGGGASESESHPVGILIDVAGNDQYLGSDTLPSFGAGVLGWGIVADLSGDDVYRTTGFFSQGCGSVGVGLLRDFRGDDHYVSMGGAQGFGRFGVGILSDDAGNDRYETYTEAQGCGLTMGFGLLVDRLGDDHYAANDSNIIFPSPQSDRHNASMCQGAGYGMRRDYLDGHSLAGGVGMLLDAAGNDRYSGGVFSQAVGYWYAIGILDDRAGNDIYQSVWYGQSATAHMGVSLLIDGAGNDRYRGSMTMTGGAAHDFSASVFVEESGDDSYEMRDNALGRSLNSSVALFADLGGNDHYVASEPSGRSVNHSAAGLRAEVPTVAVFLDLDGEDVYPDSSQRNNSQWIQSSESSIPILRGIGLDGRSLRLRWE